MSRGLLTERDREVLLGEAEDLSDLRKRQNEVRHEVRQRKDNLIEDLDVLIDAGEEGIVEDILAAGTDLSRDEIMGQLDAIEDELTGMRVSLEGIDELEIEVANLKAQINQSRELS